MVDIPTFSAAPESAFNPMYQSYQAEEPAPEPDVLMTAREAAERIGTTVNNFRQMVYYKKITVAERKGRNTFYKRADVERLAESRAAKVR